MPRDLVVLLLQQTVDGMHTEDALSLRLVCKMFQQVLDAIPADRKRCTFKHAYFYGRRQMHPLSLDNAPDVAQFVFRSSDDPFPFMTFYTFLNANADTFFNRNHDQSLFSAATMQWCSFRKRTLDKLNLAPSPDDDRLTIEYRMAWYHYDSPSFGSHGNGIVTVSIQPTIRERFNELGRSSHYLLNQEVRKIHSHFFADIRQVLLERIDMSTLQVTFTAALSPEAKKLFEWWTCHVFLHDKS
jgi:hypothetical protein